MLRHKIFAEGVVKDIKDYLPFCYEDMKCEGSLIIQFLQINFMKKKPHMPTTIQPYSQLHKVNGWVKKCVG